MDHCFWREWWLVGDGVGSLGLQNMRTQGHVMHLLCWQGGASSS